MSKAFIDYAYDVLKESKGPLAFKDLFDKTVELSNISISESSLKSKMASLYTQLSIDSRFVLCKNDQKWDLRSRYCFEDYHVSLEDVYGEETEDVDEDEEEKHLLQEELGDEEETSDDSDSDDVDFDKPRKDSSEEDF